MQFFFFLFSDDFAFGEARVVDFNLKLFLLLAALIPHYQYKLLQTINLSLIVLILFLPFIYYPAGSIRSIIHIHYPKSVCLLFQNLDELEPLAKESV